MHDPVSGMPQLLETDLREEQSKTKREQVRQRRGRRRWRKTEAKEEKAEWWSTAHEGTRKWDLRHSPLAQQLGAYVTVLLVTLNNGACDCSEFVQLWSKWRKEYCFIRQD